MTENVILPVRVRVPGSSANLGPGFDVLGVALELWLEAAVFAPGGGRPRVRLSGRHTEGIATDDSNLILKSFRRGFEAAGRPAPPVCLELENQIPLARGLGSSGAAAVAGLMLANHCGRLDLPTQRLAWLAAELEDGHPDNVTASLCGGLTVACALGEGRVETLRLQWPEGISLVVAVPEFRLETSKARAVLPVSYARSDAVFNLQRVALLVGALASGAGAARRLAAALEDRLHQPYRAPLVPGLREALELRAPGLLGVVLSGAGPSLLAWIEGSPQPAVEALEGVYRRLGMAAEVRPLAVAAAGATVMSDK
jgi:homoserine kinase